MRMLRKRYHLLILLLLFLPISVGAATQSEKGQPSNNRIVREGIAIELEMESLNPGDPEMGAGEPFREGDLVSFRFAITDTNTGTPLSGVYPAAWMDLKPSGPRVQDETCPQKVEAFIGGSLFAPPELDLNVYYVLALNNDASISVVDPLFGFGATKLLDMIFLKSPGEDWALSSDQLSLYVSMPESNQVAVADTTRWEVVTNLDVGPRPSRVALQPDERYLWVGFDGPLAEAGLSGVTVIDTKDSSVVKTILTGKGHHELAFDADNRFAFVTNEEDGTLAIIDIREMETVKTVELGETPISIAFSPIGEAVYVVIRDEGSIVAIDGKTHEVVSRMKAEPGLGQLKFAPDSRLGFVVNPEEDVVHILDASINRIIQTADVEDGPDQINFSDELAYVRHRGSEIVLMIPLDQVGGEGQPVPVVDFTGGQLPFGRVDLPSPADSIVQAPGATAVLVANPADKAIYFYKEGMAAPMGHFQNYGREPRAVLAVDGSLQERSPGVYETAAALRSPGLYDVAFFLDSPRTIHCFEVEVAPNPELVAARANTVLVEPLFEQRKLEVGETLSLQFRLSDRRTKTPKADLEDVNILTFRAPGIEQRRQWAKSVGAGVYEASFTPSMPGVYYVFVSSSSQRLGYNKVPPVILHVGNGKDDSGTAADIGRGAAERERE